MKKLIVGNWKMYPIRAKDAHERFLAIRKTALKLRNVQTVVCPPFVYLGSLSKVAKGHRCTLGAQNAWTEPEGAYTGEVSPLMLKSLDIGHVIIGHSERRALGETDELVRKKILSVIRAGLTAIVCVGERERDPDGNYLKLIGAQVTSAFQGISKKELGNMVIAYEPIWAIGKNALRAASPDDALEVSILIRKTLSELYGQVGFGIPLLYGGSVDALNAKDFLMKSQVQGLLVGRASLDPEVFGAVLQSADKLK